MGRKPYQRVRLLKAIADGVLGDPPISWEGLKALGIWDTTAAMKQMVPKVKKEGLIDYDLHRRQWTHDQWFHSLVLTEAGVTYLAEKVHILSDEPGKKPQPKPRTVSLPTPEVVVTTAVPRELSPKELFHQFFTHMPEMVTIALHLEEMSTTWESTKRELTEALATIQSQGETLSKLRKQVRELENRPRATLRVDQVHRDYRDLAKLALQQGWAIEKMHSGHLRWTSQTGVSVTTASTPSDYRSVRNDKAKLQQAGLITQ